jgi:hypothetical protein
MCHKVFSDVRSPIAIANPVNSAATLIRPLSDGANSARSHPGGADEIEDAKDARNDGRLLRQINPVAPAHIRVRHCRVGDFTFTPTRTWGSVRTPRAGASEILTP